MQGDIEHDEGNRSDEERIKEVNPFKTIWYAPRETFQSVIEYKPIRFAIVLAILFGMTEVFDEAISEEFGKHLSMTPILLITLLGGALSGIIGLAITAGLSTLIGKLFGGVGRFKEMFMAIGAAYIPVALSIVIYILHLLIVGEALFIDIDMSIVQAIWLIFSGVLTIVLSFWTLILTVLAISEVHRFSVWRALVTYIIPAVLLVLLLLLFIFFIALVF